MRAVNLLPSERPQETRGGTSGGGGFFTTTRVAIVGGSVAAIVCAGTGFMFVGARGDAAKQRDALTAIQQQVDAARVKAAQREHEQQSAQQAADAATALPADIKTQLDTFNLVASQRVKWDQLLGDVSRVLPKGSWLSSVAIQGPAPVDPTAAAAAPTTPTTPTVATTPTGFTATGFALSHETVARLLQQLALVPMLSDVTLQRSERADVGADKAFQFTLSANVRLDGQS
jgi:Tfp pilus assembly protein PilN